MAVGLAILNENRNTQSLEFQNAICRSNWYNAMMAKSRKIAANTRWDWYLRDWLGTCGKIQADLEKEMDWNRSKASFMMNGKQKYTRNEVNQIAEWLNIFPYELLMHPSDAMSLRRIREDAIKIAEVDKAGPTPPGTQPIEKIPGRVKVGNSGS